MTMTFDEILSQVLDLLQREQRLSYCALKLRFQLDDEYIEVFKEDVTKGYGSLEAQETFTRAWELCQHLEESSQLVIPLYRR